jgi:hypothetical protein
VLQALTGELILRERCRTAVKACKSVFSPCTACLEPFWGPEFARLLVTKCSFEMEAFFVGTFTVVTVGLMIVGLVVVGLCSAVFAKLVCFRGVTGL